MATLDSVGSDWLEDGVGDWENEDYFSWKDEWIGEFWIERAVGCIIGTLEYVTNLFLTTNQETIKRKDFIPDYRRYKNIKRYIKRDNK